MEIIKEKQVQKKWTISEIENLKIDYLEFLPKGYMEEKYKRNWANIQAKANNLGLKSGNKNNSIRKKAISNVKDILKDYNNEIPIKEICNKYSISQTLFYSILDENNIKKKNNYKQWTLEEKISLEKDYINRVSFEELSVKYNLQINNLKRIFRKFKTKRKSLNNLLNDSIDLSEVINLYNKGLSLTKIANLYECSDTFLNNILKCNNINRKTNSDYRKFKVDENYFDKIDCEDKAYLLGFLYADGYVSETNNYIKVVLQKDDYLILEYLKEKINAENIIKFRTVYNKEKDKNYYNCGITLHSKKLVKSLVNLGCMQGKSLILQFPTEEQVPSYLHSHFIRGYFDGDGSIYQSKTIKSNCCFSIEGNEDFLIGLQNILITKCDLKKVKIIKKNSIKKSSVAITYSGKVQIKRIFDYLYKDFNFCLDRKLEKFKKLFNVQ